MTIVRAGEELTALSLFHAEDLASHQPSTALTAPFTVDRVRWRDPVHAHIQDSLDHESLRHAESGVIVRFAGGNPTFDILMTAPCSQDKKSYIALTMEVRMSNVGSSAKESQFQDKLKLWRGNLSTVKNLPAGVPRDGVQSLFKRMNPPPAHVVYVYAAVQPKERAVQHQQASCKSDVLLLSNGRRAEKRALAAADRSTSNIASEGTDHRPEPSPRATLQRALTPTLADRAFFLLDFHDD